MKVHPGFKPPPVDPVDPKQLVLVRYRAAVAAIRATGDQATANLLSNGGTNDGTLLHVRRRLLDQLDAAGPDAQRVQEALDALGALWAVVDGR